MIPFQVSTYDVGGVHSTSVNPTRFTIPVGQGGNNFGACVLWHLTGSVSFAASATGSRVVGFIKDGSIPLGYSSAVPSAGFATGVGAAADAQLCDGDYVELQVIQNSGGALNTSGDYGTYMSIARAW
jgi:hypothetical protein